MLGDLVHLGCLIHRTTNEEDPFSHSPLQLPLAIVGGLPYASPHAETPIPEDAGSHLERLPLRPHLSCSGGTREHHRLALAAGEVRPPDGLAGGGGRGQGPWSAPDPCRLLPVGPGSVDLRFVAIHPRAEPRRPGRPPDLDRPSHPGRRPQPLACANQHPLAHRAPPACVFGVLCPALRVTRDPLLPAASCREGTRTDTRKRGGLRPVPRGSSPVSLLRLHWLHGTHGPRAPICPGAQVPHGTHRPPCRRTDPAPPRRPGGNQARRLPKRPHLRGLDQPPLRVSIHASPGLLRAPCGLPHDLCVTVPALPLCRRYPGGRDSRRPLHLVGAPIPSSRAPDLPGMTAVQVARA